MIIMITCVLIFFQANKWICWKVGRRRQTLGVGSISLFFPDWLVLPLLSVCVCVCCTYIAANYLVIFITAKFWSYILPKVSLFPFLLLFFHQVIYIVRNRTLNFTLKFMVGVDENRVSRQQKRWRPVRANAGSPWLPSQIECERENLSAAMHFFVCMRSSSKLFFLYTHLFLLFLSFSGSSVQ